MADLKEVLRFFLRAKKELFGLSDGKWSFRVREEEGETALFSCSVKGEEIRVRRFSEEEADPAEWEKAEEWEKGELARFLFGTASFVRHRPGIPAGWLPLPLYLPSADAV